ncbi:MAG: nuclear transport factor 2 family protein, partial [Rubrobacteraceae bacterium]|nr:nuclear transport factor 2 family protein [Rubrobacteraceae bacterium]
MSQENVEIVRQVYDAIDRGDTQSVLSHYDPEVEWDFDRSPIVDLVKRSVYRGHDALKEFIRERYEDAWESIDDELQELIEAGDCVVSVVNTRGRGRASGAEVEMTHAGLWTIRDRRIIRVAWFSSVAEALEAAGLR